MSKKIETSNLILKSSSIEFAEETLNYYLRNLDFLKEFEPKRSDKFFTMEGQLNLLSEEIEGENLKSSYKFYIFTKEKPNHLIGMVNLNNIVWGAFLSCFLGYKLDKDYINKGYMTEALTAITSFAFEDLGLHRVEGNVLPRNKASLKVLEKCAYVNEGRSKDYLKINGVWEDHIHMVKLNSNNL